MSGHEAMLAFEYLQTTLTGDATLTGYAPGGVWRSMAPPGVSTPFVIVAHHAGTDVLTMNAVRLMDNLLFQVKAVGPAADTVTVANAAAEIDKVLKRPAPAQTADALGGVLACFREEPMQLDEIVDGELWTNIGGLYRLLIQQIA